MSDIRAKQIALLLQAVIDIDKEKADWLREWKERRESLTNDLNVLRANILHGQMELPTEPIVDLDGLRETDEHHATA